MTHLLAADPRDAHWLAENRRPQARWWLPALPARAGDIATATDRPPLLFGDSPAPQKYGEKCITADTSSQFHLTDEAAQIPLILTQTGEQIAGILRSGSDYPAELPQLHTDALRQLQGMAFDQLASAVAASPAIVIAERPPFVQIALTLLAISGGRSVLALAAQERPELASWFASAPGVSAPTDALTDFATDLAGLTPPAEAAAAAFLAGYRLDERLRDWIDWIATSGGKGAVTTAAPTAGPLRQIADLVAVAESAFQREDFDAAILALEQARQADPLNPDIAMLHGEVRSLREDRVRERIESTWQRQMAL